MLGAWVAMFDYANWIDPEAKARLISQLPAMRELLRGGAQQFDPGRDRDAFEHHLKHEPRLQGSGLRVFNGSAAARGWWVWPHPAVIADQRGDGDAPARRATKPFGDPGLELELSGERRGLGRGLQRGGRTMILTRAPRAAVVAALCTVVLTGCATSAATITTNTRPPAANTPRAAETTTATRGQPSAPAASCADGDYVTRAFCYLSKAGVRNSMINADCGPLLANDLHDPGHACRNEIERYETVPAGSPAPAAPPGSRGRPSERCRARLVAAPCRQRRPRSGAPGTHSHPLARLPRLPERLGRARQSRPRTANRPRHLPQPLTSPQPRRRSLRELARLLIDALERKML